MAIDQVYETGAVIAEGRQLRDEVRALIAEARAHARDVQLMLTSPRAGLKKRSHAAADITSSAPSRPVPPPDALCALFDALYEAVRQADAHGDPELIALVEQAFLRAGEKVAAIAAAMAEHRGFVQ